MPTPLCVLIVEDCPTDAEVMVGHLRKAGYAPEWRRVVTEADFLAHLDPPPDLILIGYALPDFDGRRALELLCTRGYDVPAIIVTGSTGEETALELLRLGAADYLLKDRLARLGAAVRKALEHRTLRRERAVAEVTIQDSEGRYRRFFDGAVLGIFQSTPEGKILDANPTYAQMFGYASPEEIKQAVRDVATDLYADPARRRDLVKRILEGRAPVVVENLYRRRDGSTFPALLHAWRVHDGASRLSYLEGFVEDITDRKQAEEGLTRRTQQLEAVRMVTGEVARELDLTVLLDLIIQRATRLVGSAIGAILLWEERHQHLVPRAWLGGGDWLREVRVKAGEGISGMVVEQRRGVMVDDYSRWPGAHPRVLDHPDLAAAVAEPLLCRDRFVGVIVVYRERGQGSFTEEDRATLALFAAQAAAAIENARLHQAAVRRGAELEALLRATHSIMSGLDLHRILDQILAEAAEMAGTAHVRVTLVDREAGVLRVARVNGGLVPPESEYPLESLSGLVVASGEPVFSPNVAADPRVYFRSQYEDLALVTYLGLPIKSRGKVVGILIFNTTEPREYTPQELAYLTSFADQAAIALENARLYQQAQKYATSLEARVQQRTVELAQANRNLQMASRRKSEFLANMSHELRTPLNSILGFAQILLEQTGAVLSTKQTRYLANIHSSGQHLLQLINDILDLSKVEAGKFTLQCEPLPVAETLEDILVIVRGLANRKGLLIATETAPALPPLSADPVRFKQILFNLLSNAVKFTPERGTITVSARRVAAEAATRGTGETESRGAGGSPAPIPRCSASPVQDAAEWLEIRVTDTGAGIKPEDLPRLFQEFVQLEATQAQHHEGTGLGLALTKRLVELHGGRIRAESEGEGKGSTFTVVLPFSGPKAD